MAKLEFNVAGPCIPGEHYMLDPFRGIGNELMSLIDGKKYFVIHAARQSGKTTLLKGLARQINAQGNYYALYCSLEVVGESEPGKGIPAIVRTIKIALKEFGMPDGFAVDADYDDTSNVLKTTLTSYCRMLNKPLVIFFDEADGLTEGTLISFLRQLRYGYINRPDIPFVHSIALVGMRNLGDYKAQVRPGSETLGSLSPFNIITKTFNLRNFTQSEVAELYAQHTAETGQVFEPASVDYAFEQTQGQPWLVNTIARNAVVEITKDPSLPVTPGIVEQAVRQLIFDRGTHIGSFIERLKEPRVRRVIEPLILGDEVVNKDSDDYLYTRDIGLIRENNGKIEPANPIYAELIVRTLSWVVQESIGITHEEYSIPRYLNNGKLDMNFLIRDFQEYWRENSEIWKSRYEKDLFQYVEAAPHLVMQAFLQRVVNGGGQVIRNMALGKKLLDLCVVYNGQKYPVELKILQNQKSYEKSLNQIADYMDIAGTNTGWLVIFDRDENKSWDEKIYIKEENVNGKKIIVAGC